MGLCVTFTVQLLCFPNPPGKYFEICAHLSCYFISLAERISRARSQYNVASTASARTPEERYCRDTFHFTVVSSLLVKWIYSEDVGLRFSGMLRALLASKVCGGERLFEALTGPALHLPAARLRYATTLSTDSPKQITMSYFLHIHC